MQTYDPLDTVKPVANDVWIVDGPIIRFGPPLLRMPFPTRMTVVRIGDALFVHSPTRLTASLREAITALGAVRWIVAPNRLHYWWVSDWHRGWPQASVYLAPQMPDKARRRIGVTGLSLDRDEGYPWDDALGTRVVRGRAFSEAVFFHRASRTLILTDMIENFEPQRIDAWWMRWLVRLGGVGDPHGSMPRDMRFAYDRTVLRRAVETMVAWAPERIILAHGRWYGRNGADELGRAFAWLLERVSAAR
ncbi:MAG: DUF4336 domain-containing protein [Pseudolabrys sp.]